MKLKGTGLRFWNRIEERDAIWNKILEFYGTDVPLKTSQKRIIPFQFRRTNDAETVLAMYVVYADGAETQVEEDMLFEETDGTYDWILYFGQKVVDPDCFREIELDEGRAYVRIEMEIATYYSDWFEICDVLECETEMVSNNEFTDWTLDDPDGWTVTEDANNEIKEADELLCNDTCEWECADAVTDAAIEQDILIEDTRYFVAIGVIDDSDPGLDVNGFDDSPHNVDAIGYHKFIDIADGDPFKIIEDPAVGNACNMKVTRASVENFDLLCIEDYLTFEFWNENDSCGMLYQTGYRGWMNFDAKLTKPESKIIEESEESETGEESPIVQSQHKRYQIKLTGGESLFDDVTKLRLYDYVYVVLPDGERYRMYSIEVDSDWIDDYVCEFEISFYIEICSVAGCEDNYTLS